MVYLVLLLAATGHAVLWAATVNRLHGTAVNQSLRKFTSGICLVLAATFPLLIAWIAYRDAWLSTATIPSMASSIAWTYVIVCAIAFIAAVVHWSILHWHEERRGALISNHTSVIKRRPPNGVSWTAPGIPTLLGRLPGNQILEIRVHEKELAIPRLSPAHNGVRVAHISDLHMSGRITKAYFEQVVDEVNRAHPDLIILTGDIVERHECLDWIPDTLGRLRAPHGVYFVLGNHDRRVDFRALTTALTDAGLVHLGGAWQLITVRDAPILLAGNELPWFKPTTISAGPPPSTLRPPPSFRLLVAHTPDQFRWAQEHDFDLMLAGHNHGGQVCLPVIGPILAPSLHGVRYAAGVFRAASTVMHVSRGTSGLTPIRFNCPPEIAILILRPAV